MNDPDDPFDLNDSEPKGPDWKSLIVAGIVLVILIVVVAVTQGCTTSPPTPPPRTGFERCMDTVGKNFYYTSDRVTAANWCKNNGNGGMQ